MPNFNILYNSNQEQDGTQEHRNTGTQEHSWLLLPLLIIHMVYFGTLQPGSQSDRIVLEQKTTGIHQLRVTVNGETRMSAKLVILN